VGQLLNSTNSVLTFSFPVQVQVFTTEEKILGSMSNDELLRNLGSQVMNALLKRASKNTLVGSYDIMQVSLVGGNTVLGPTDEGELQLPLLFEMEFLNKY
jgi:hypothetical protein